MINYDTLKKNFNKCGYITRIFENKKELIDAVFEFTRDKTVGFGSSITVNDLEIVKNIEHSAKDIFLHEIGEAGEIERKALTSDVFITSANAVSLTGEIINIDGTGNRVAATCFGPKIILYIIGCNKITENLDQAMNRAKETAIKLASKYNRKTPCVKTGKCSYCYSPQCVCAITTIHRKKPFGVEIVFYILNEDIGL